MTEGVLAFGVEARRVRRSAFRVRPTPAGGATEVTAACCQAPFIRPSYLPPASPARQCSCSTPPCSSGSSCAQGCLAVVTCLNPLHSQPHGRAGGTVWQQLLYLHYVSVWSKLPCTTCMHAVNCKMSQWYGHSRGITLHASHANSMCT